MRNGDEAWVLLDERPERGLGPALAWARQKGASVVHVVADSGTGVLARRAAAFAEPPLVWQADGRSLHPAHADPFPAPGTVDPELLELGPLIELAGADPIVEHGVLVGEVAGLEVCRAVRDEHLGVVRLEVGVGAHDREAFQLMHGDVPTEQSLARVVAVVAEHRRPSSPPHPLNRLGAERALRARLVDEPALVGARQLAVASPPVPRTNLKDPVPCVAAGEGPSGAPVVVVCSVGIDLDVVPFAADARGALAAQPGSSIGPDADLVIAVPERDVHPVTRALAEMLRHPARIVGISPLAG